jgi:hypothetical protein
VAGTRSGAVVVSVTLRRASARLARGRRVARERNIGQRPRFIRVPARWRASPRRVERASGAGGAVGTRRRQTRCGLTQAPGL